MTREHKFKVWHKGTLMLNGLPDKQRMSPKSYTLFRMIEVLSKYDITPENCLFLEWTGLLDKNGKEIYEGDILQSAGIVAWNDAEVRWSCIDITWNNKREWHDMLYLTTPLEIIGNIYENPELLK